MEIIEQAVNDFEDFLIAELDAVLLGDIPMKRKDSMLHTNNIREHFNIMRKQMRLKVK